MPKNGIPGGGWPPDKKKVTSRVDYTDHENPALTLAQEAARARDAVKKSPASTEGTSIAEEHTKAKATLKEADSMSASLNINTSSAWSQDHYSLSEQIEVQNGKPSDFHLGSGIKKKPDEERVGVSALSLHAEAIAQQERPKIPDAHRAEPAPEAEIEAGVVLELNTTDASKGLVARESVFREHADAVATEEARLRAEARTTPMKSPSQVSADSSLPSDATPLERKRRLRSAIIEESAKKMDEQGEKSSLARQAYFDALKTYQKNRGFGGIVAESLVGDKLLTPKALKELRHAWVYERALHAATQRAAIEVRLKEKPATREAMLERLKAKQEAKGTYDPEKHDIQKRYERMVTLKSVVTGQEEEELAVRTEGFSTRDKKSLELMFERYKKVPSALRIFGTSAVLLGGTAVLAGSPIGLAALGMVGASAGLRYWAEKVKQPEVRKWLNGVAPIASIAGAAGALADYGIQFGHKIAGTERKASELLTKKEGLGDLDSVENLEHLSQERRKALVVKENIARQGRVARMLTSVGLGFFLGHHASGATSETSTDSIADHSHTTASGVKEHITVETAPSTPEHNPVQTVEPVIAHPEPYSVTIEPGQGMDKLFVELRDHYKEIYPDPNAASVPPGIRHILNAHSGDELSREFGFINGENGSYVMKAGDSLGFDAKGNLVFTPHADGSQSVELLHQGSGTPHHLTAAEQEGHFETHTRTSIAATHPDTHSTSAVSAPDNREAMLNRLQTAHPSEPVSHEEVIASTHQPDHEVLRPFGAPHLSEHPQDLSSVESSAVASPATPETTLSPETHAPEAVPQAPTEAAPVVHAVPESSTSHAFAEPGAASVLNPHGVDLNKPQLLLNHGLKFAHGIDTEDSFSRAYEESLRLSKIPGADTHVYFVARDFDALGNPYLAVRMVFAPPDGSLPQVAPYGEGVSLSPEFTMPSLPKDADYQAVS